jgi:tetratricopeptide (TPR) repeat protein
VILPKALAKDPADRYASVAELSGDLRRFLANEPIAAKSPSAWYSFKKFAQRQRALVAVAAVSVVLLLITSGVAVGQAMLATRERDAAERRLSYARETAAYTLWGVGSQIDYVLGTRDIKRHLVEVSYKYHRRLADEDPDDPAAQLGLWRALEGLVYLSIEVGDDERITVLCDMLRDKLEVLSHTHPGVAVVLRTQAALYTALARNAEAMDDLVMARAHASQALEISRVLVDRIEPVAIETATVAGVAQSGADAGAKPAHVEDRFALAKALARGEDLSDEPGIAEGQYQEALRLLDAVMPTDPTLDPLYHDDLSAYAPLAPPILLRVGSRPHYIRLRASILMGLGRLDFLRGNHVKAQESLSRALAILEQLSHDQPLVPTNVRALAECHARLSEVRAATGEIELAAMHAREASHGYRRLHNADPRNIEYRDLADSLGALLGR